MILILFHLGLQFLEAIMSFAKLAHWVIDLPFELALGALLCGVYAHFQVLLHVYAQNSLVAQ